MRRRGRQGAAGRTVDKRRKGAHFERLAADFLKEEGYKVIERNYSAASGEIDIIAEEGGCLCFVEVRSRYGAALGDVAASVGAEKRRRLVATSLLWRRQHRAEHKPVRYDLVVISRSGGKTAIKLIRNAFEPRRFCW